jgi:hypothetical protein
VEGTGCRLFEGRYRITTAATRSKAWVYGRSLAGIVGSKPSEGMDVCLL